MDPAKVSTGHTFHMAATFCNGGLYWDDDLTKIMWNEQPGLQAAEWELNFVKAQAGKYENLAIADDRKNVIRPESWKPQKYICAINGSWFVFQLKSVAPEIDYGITTFPTNADNPDSKLATPINGGWAFAIASAGKDKEAVWEWIKFTTASDAACDFVAAQNRPSPNKKCNEDPRLSEGHPNWQAITDDLSHKQADASDHQPAGVHPALVRHGGRHPLQRSRRPRRRSTRPPRRARSSSKKRRRRPPRPSARCRPSEPSKRSRWCASGPGAGPWPGARPSGGTSSSPPG